MKRLAGVASLVLGVLIVVGYVTFQNRYARFTIPQNGMFPGLPAGSRFWARKKPYARIEEVKRGDIIIFRQRRPDGVYDFVWRVLGLPGERIAIREDAVIIDGKPLARTPGPDEGDVRFFEESSGPFTYLIALPRRMTDAGAFPETMVPPGHLFVLGDNRHQANDSRSMGPIPFETIVARLGWW
jgi:signal peptidase I